MKVLGWLLVLCVAAALLADAVPHRWDVRSRSRFMQQVWTFICDIWIFWSEGVSLGCLFPAASLLSFVQRGRTSAGSLVEAEVVSSSEALTNAEAVAAAAARIEAEQEQLFQAWRERVLAYH